MEKSRNRALHDIPCGEHLISSHRSSRCHRFRITGALSPHSHYMVAPRCQRPTVHGLAGEPPVGSAPSFFPLLVPCPDFLLFLFTAGAPASSSPSMPSSLSSSLRHITLTISPKDVTSLAPSQEQTFNSHSSQHVKALCCRQIVGNTPGLSVLQGLRRIGEDADLRTRTQSGMHGGVGQPLVCLRALLC